MFSICKITITTLIAICLNFTIISHSFATTEEKQISYVIDKLTINIRDNISSHFQVVQRVYSNDELKIIGEQGKYYHVETKSGKIGWISKKYTTTIQPKSLLIEKLLAEIKKLKSSKAVSSKTEDAPLKKELQLAKEQATLLQDKLTEYETILKKLEIEQVQNEKLLKIIDNLKNKSQSPQSAEKTATITKNTPNEQGEVTEKRKNIYWFIAGVIAVLLCLIIIKISTRKKKKLSFYY